MPEITKEQIHKAYELGKCVFQNKLSAKDAVKSLSNEHDMNSSSAQIYIQNFLYMIEGKKYTRNINLYATDFYLESIRNDFGVLKKIIALEAVKLHVNYYKDVVDSGLPKFTELIKKHEREVIGYEMLEDRLIEFENNVQEASKDSFSNRQERLKKHSGESETKISIIKTQKRNADVVAEVLSRASGICEECDQKAPFKRRSTGEPYLEVHHVIPLSKGGLDLIDNAQALCPNCHKRMHFGEK
ncbi:MAG: HNH endonuclease [Fibrobacterales bacterium]